GVGGAPPGGRVCGVLAGATPRVRDFDVPDGNVGAAHGPRDPVEPVVRLRNVEDEITREEQVEIAHEPWGQLVRSINYSYYYHQSRAAVESRGPEACRQSGSCSLRRSAISVRSSWERYRLTHSAPA